MIFIIKTVAQEQLNKFTQWEYQKGAFYVDDPRFSKTELQFCKYTRTFSHQVQNCKL